MYIKQKLKRTDAPRRGNVSSARERAHTVRVFSSLRTFRSYTTFTLFACYAIEKHNNIYRFSMRVDCDVRSAQPMPSLTVYELGAPWSASLVAVSTVVCVRDVIFHITHHTI